MAFPNFDVHVYSCYDSMAGSTFCKSWTWWPWYAEVQQGSLEKLRDSKDVVLVLCWPEPDTLFARDCVKKFEGDLLVFIGERKGGCTAEDLFYD